MQSEQICAQFREFRRQRIGFFLACKSGVGNYHSAVKFRGGFVFKNKFIAFHFHKSVFSAGFIKQIRPIDISTRLIYVFCIQRIPLTKIAWTGRKYNRKRLIIFVFEHNGNIVKPRLAFSVSQSAFNPQFYGIVALPDCVSLTI